MIVESTAVCNRRTAKDAGRRSTGSAASGARTARPRGRPGSWSWCAAMRSSRSSPGSGGCVDACGPRIPGLSAGAVWGLTSCPPVSPAGFPPASRLPAGFSPSPAIPWLPFVRRSPVRSLRPLPGSGSTSVPLRVPFPLSNLRASAAAERFRRPSPPATGTKVISPAATSHWIVVPRGAPAVGVAAGWTAPGSVSPWRGGH